MQSRHRDGLLACVVLAALGAVAAGLGYGLARLVQPLPTAIGAGGALALELLCARFPERSRELWYRRDVQAGAILLVVVGGGLLAAAAGPWVLTTLAAGLLTYLGLLAGTLAGLVPDPAVWFETGRDDGSVESER